MYDVIPDGALSSLSAEDLRLVLCGCHWIDTDRLRTITVFEDESSECMALPHPLSTVTLSSYHRERRRAADQVQGVVLGCG